MGPGGMAAWCVANVKVIHRLAVVRAHTARLRREVAYLECLGQDMGRSYVFVQEMVPDIVGVAGKVETMFQEVFVFLSDMEGVGQRKKPVTSSGSMKAVDDCIMSTASLWKNCINIKKMIAEHWNVAVEIRQELKEDGRGEHACLPAPVGW